MSTADRTMEELAQEVLEQLKALNRRIRQVERARPQDEIRLRGLYLARSNLCGALRLMGRYLA